MLFETSCPLSPIQRIDLVLTSEKNIELWIKRDDLIHPFVSGNKFRKLKYNFLALPALGKNKILTFGGPFSNHIYAMASACHLFGIPCTAIIRGELDLNNPTLKHCITLGMELIPVSREMYRQKENSTVVQDILRTQPGIYVIPEGGSNELALRGVGEIVDEIILQNIVPDYVVVACGTGGTTAGLLSSDKLTAQVLSISVLKNDQMRADVMKWLTPALGGRLTMVDGYRFGGYALWDENLMGFIKDFEAQTKISLDHVYNGKAMYGLLEMIKNDYFPSGSKILYLHTGGLQGEIGRKYMEDKKSGLK
jgi:1-aminocyclopropane-1-carboxylate deaminase